ncbi:MAG TPA: hypothetical protein VNJ08_01860 [Bacteriovoracaceae bacterium]|nr:hypothetical protein [Bacteriovoracaceae bacterium]
MRLFVLFSEDTQKFISNYMVMGLVPLDKVLHFLVGLIITLVMRFLSFKMKYVFLLLAALEIIKEFNDYAVLNSSRLEQVYDIVATFLYPLILLGVLRFKERLRLKIRQKD